MGFLRFFWRRDTDRILYTFGFLLAIFGLKLVSKLSNSSTIAFNADIIPCSVFLEKDDDFDLSSALPKFFLNLCQGLFESS